MNNIGAEVGQKMRSAIKAKLMELGCYVDDELPDYIMVMVANKRTTSQMNEDLQLFLTTKTATFVDWLQIVLKKLKEITVTNPEIYKRVTKRTSEDDIPTKPKKEKKEKPKSSKKSKLKKDDRSSSFVKCLSDDLPVDASKLSGMRKIVVMQENQNSSTNLDAVNEDCFDIPPLSEVAISNDQELEEIEQKIKNVKSRLGMQVESESDDEDFLNIKAEPEDLFPNEQTLEVQQRKAEEHNGRKIKLVAKSDSAEDQNNINNSKDYLDDFFIESPSAEEKPEHPRIIFANKSEAPKKQSALERLGKKSTASESDDGFNQKHKKINLITIRKQEEQILGSSKANKEAIQSNNENDFKKISSKVSVLSVPRESALKRLGVMSKVAVPNKKEVESDEEVIIKDVPSAIKVKPRTIPPLNNQANKNLLLKAVAEAQRSVAQTPIVGSNIKPDALFTKKFREKLVQNQTTTRKISDEEKIKLKNILLQVENKELNCDSNDNLEYVPRSPKKLRRPHEPLKYIPSSKESNGNDEPSEINTNTLPRESTRQNFIITLDGILRHPDRNVLPTKSAQVESLKTKNSEETKRRSPSPIIFDKNVNVVSSIKTNASPDKLSLAIQSTSLKPKERCKYWPACRQGDKCEFIHPNAACKAFPYCKFGEKCLYIHPMCKFESSCTKKDCPYKHVTKTFNNGSAIKNYHTNVLLHKTYYEVLGLNKNCTAKDIKNAYITLSKKYHPDNNKGTESHQNFIQISEAYSTLSKPDKRQHYDWELSRRVQNQRPTRVSRHYSNNRRTYDDPTFWRNQERYYYDRYNEDNYYGFPGVKKVSNGVIFMICICFTLICSSIQFFAIKRAYNMRNELMSRRSIECRKHLQKVEQEKEKNGDLQIALMEEKLLRGRTVRLHDSIMTNNKYKIEIAKEAHIDLLCNFVKDHFSEPIKEALGVVYSNDMLKKALTKAIPQELSFIAIESSGNIIGLVENAEFLAEQETNHEVGSGNELFDIYNFLTEQINISSEKCSKEMELRIVVVHKDWRQKGIARELIKKALTYAREKGFQKIRSSCSSAYSTKLFTECGFKSVCSFKYEDLKDKGKLTAIPSYPHTHINGVVIKLPADEF
ncbi:hypothetical protein FQA39_LY00604 [Lamprigera yunnana]|nr:hypothetical protein FQA39_LY00604 [Lamprigera yunnana]